MFYDLGVDGLFSEFPAIAISVRGDVALEQR
jgi:hypothetical protein